MARFHATGQKLQLLHAEFSNRSREALGYHRLRASLDPVARTTTTCPGYRLNLAAQTIETLLLPLVVDSQHREVVDSFQGRFRSPSDCLVT